MIDLKLTQAIATRLAAEFPACYVGEPLSSGEISLPAILLGITSNAIPASPLQRGTLSVHVESSADDSTAAAHAELVVDVDAFVTAMSFTEGSVHLAGIVRADLSNTPQDRHWQTAMTYTVGFETV
jgi:hypothetical protein